MNPKKPWRQHWRAVGDIEHYRTSWNIIGHRTLWNLVEDYGKLQNSRENFRTDLFKNLVGCPRTSWNILWPSKVQSYKLNSPAVLRVRDSPYLLAPIVQRSETSSPTHPTLLSPCLHQNWFCWVAFSYHNNIIQLLSFVWSLTQDQYLQYNLCLYISSIQISVWTEGRPFRQRVL